MRRRKEGSWTKLEIWHRSRVNTQITIGSSPLISSETLVLHLAGVFSSCMFLASGLRSFCPDISTKFLSTDGATGVELLGSEGGNLFNTHRCAWVFMIHMINMLCLLRLLVWPQLPMWKWAFSCHAHVADPKYVRQICEYFSHRGFVQLKMSPSTHSGQESVRQRPRTHGNDLFTRIHKKVPGHPQHLWVTQTPWAEAVLFDWPGEGACILSKKWNRHSCLHGIRTSAEDIQSTSFILVLNFDADSNTNNWAKKQETLFSFLAQK